LEGRKAEKDRFLHIFPAFLPSKESVFRSVSGNRISTEIWTAEFAPAFPAASFQSPAITSNVRDTAVAGEIMSPMRRPC
jgi:hypothetical protein